MVLLTVYELYVDFHMLLHRMNFCISRASKNVLVEKRREKNTRKGENSPSGTKVEIERGLRGIRNIG